MADLFEGLDDDPETRRLVAASLACEQCRALHAGGVRQFHFYTLNRAELSHGHLPRAGRSRPKATPARQAAVGV